jgi:hypothetical protein
MRRHHFTCNFSRRGQWQVSKGGILLCSRQPRSPSARCRLPLPTAVAAAALLCCLSRVASMSRSRGATRSRAAAEKGRQRPECNQAVQKRGSTRRWVMAVVWRNALKATRMASCELWVAVAHVLKPPHNQLTHTQQTPRCESRNCAGCGDKCVPPVTTAGLTQTPCYTRLIL